MNEAGGIVRRSLGALGRLGGRLWQFIKRHKKLFIILVALVVVGAIGLTVLGNVLRGQSMAGGLSLPETTTLARMDLELTVTSTGTLQSADVHSVTSSLSYDVSAIYVEEGDSVNEGDILCILDSEELDKTIADLKKDIAKAVADDAKTLADLQLKINEAIETRGDNYAKNDKAVSEAYAVWQNAETLLKEVDQILSGINTTLTNNLYNALIALTYTHDQSTYLAAKIRSADDVRALVVSGELKADDYDKITKDNTISLNFAEYSNAQKNYESALAASTSALEAYDKAVDTRDTAYKSDTKSIETAQKNYNDQAAKDSAESLRDQLEDYEDQRDDLTIKAPAAGTITAMTAEVGKSAGGSAATGSASGSTGSSSGSALFTIENMARLEVPLSIAEYDAISLVKGMAAHLSTDAVDDKTWNASISKISPTAASGYFTVTVEVSSTVDELTPGMSATVDIVTQSVQNVYAVPYDAVVTNAAGQTVVYALDLSSMDMGGRPGAGPGDTESDDSATLGGDDSEADPGYQRTEIVVTTGLETDYYIEISGEGLSDGLLILNDPLGNTVQATPSANEFSDEGGMTFNVGGGDMGGGGMPDGGGAMPGGGGPPG